MSEQENIPKIFVDDVEYPIDSVSNEVKELLSLHQEAQAIMVEARKRALIHELAIANLTQLIKQKIEQPSEGELVEPEPA